MALIKDVLEDKGRDVATIGPDATLGEAVVLLAGHGIGALVVSDDGTTVEGVLSERDIVRAMARTQEPVIGERVGDVCTAGVHTCGETETTDHLMGLMTENRIRHVPVVDGNRLVGIVTIGDVVKARVADLKTEKEQVVDYIQNPR